jgi:hypothetical protein
MSNARKDRRKGSNPLAVLANADRKDRCKTGAIRAPRNVLVTARVSIARDFTAPDPMTGEYSRVDQRAIEAVAGTAGWTDKDKRVIEVNAPDNHLPVGLADRLLEEIGSGDRKRAAYLARREEEKFDAAIRAALGIK